MRRLNFFYTALLTMLVGWALPADAQSGTWKADFKSGTLAAGTELVDNEVINVKTVYDSPTGAESKTIGTEDFTSYLQVRVGADPSADVITGTSDPKGSPLVITAKKDTKLTVYYCRQKGSNGFDESDNKDMLLQDQAAVKTVINGEITVTETFSDGKEDFDNYAYAYKTYSLTEGHTYTLYRKGSTMKVYGLGWNAGSEPVANYAIVKVDEGDRVYYSLWDEEQGKEIDYYLPAGETKFEIPEGGLSRVFYVKNGFGVKSFTNVTKGIEVDPWFGSFMVFFDVENYGDVFEIVTYNEDDVRTASMNFYIDNAAKVEVMRRMNNLYKTIDGLVDGDNVIKFDPTSETEILVREVNYGALYKVIADGVEIKDEYGNYKVPCVDGSKVEVYANFPDKDVNVTIKLANEGTEKAIKQALVNDAPVADFSSFTAKLGDRVGIDVNTVDYLIESITLNGVELEDPQWGYSDYALQENMDFVVTARPYNTFNVTIEVNDPKAVVVYKGEMWDDVKLALQPGVNTVEISEASPMITIQQSSGSVINKITNNGDEIFESWGAYGVALKAGDYVVIDATAPVRTAKAIVWIDDVTAADQIRGMGRGDYSPYDDADGILNSGENIVMFDPAIDNPFYISFSGSNLADGAVKVFLNDELLTPDWGNLYENLYLKDGDYIKCYFNEVPAPHYATIKVDAADRIYYTDYDSTTGEEKTFYFPAGETKIEIPEGGKTWNIYIEDGFGVTSFTNVTKGEEVRASFWSGAYLLYLDEQNYGDVFEVVTFDQEALRTASMSFYIDNVAKVDVLRKANNQWKSVTGLADGDNVIKFNPEAEDEFIVRELNYGLLYKVVVDGVELADEYGDYHVPCVDGSKVEIYANFPDKDVNVTIAMANPGTEKAIKEVRVNDIVVEDYSSLVVKLGDKVGIDVNTADYNVTSITLNGVEQDYPKYGYSGYALEDKMDFVITAEPYKTFTVSVEINDPKAVTVYKGSKWDDIKLALQQGVNTVELSEAAPQIVVVGNSGATINKITNNGEEVTESWSGYTVELKEGDYVVIDAKGAKREAKAIVWCDDVTAANYVKGMCRADGSEYDDLNGILNTGDNIVMFDPDVDNPFEITFSGETLAEGAVKIYINDATESLVPVFNNYFNNIILKDGDVIKCYLKDDPTNINNAIVNVTTTTASYNLAGQKVSSAFKGIVIKNNKKVVVK